MTSIPRLPLLLSLAGVIVVAGGIGIAQIEPGERGIAPIDSSSSYEVTGVAVDIAARDADSARTAGWREAQRKGWRMLYARVHGVPLASAPGLADGTLDSIVGGIVVEDEQIGPRRYIARLGVLFDRARAGALLGVGGEARRSAPMLTIPVLWSGGAPVSYELRNPWQAAWARFRTGGSQVDYVRPVGTGIDPLLLNAAQGRRPGRTWWRLLLDQYGASDILMPEVALNHLWPGGPIVATFTARHGPDGAVIDRFVLRTETGAGLPKLLDDGIRRMDDSYAAALRQGALSPDPSLVLEEAADPVAIDTPDEEDVTVGTAAAAAGAAYVLQVDTPDAAALAQAEAAIRAVPGMRSVATTSLALGGVSILRVVFEGDSAGLSIALAARGLRAEETGDSSFRIRRTGAAPQAPPGEGTQ